MRTWPALEVGKMKPGVIAEADAQSHPVSFFDMFQAALTDYDIAAIDDSADDPWRVFFHAAAERDRAAAALRRDFPTLTITPLDVPDEDWAARSQANLHAVRVGNVVVAPPWDVPVVTLEAKIVIIQPSMGFGTGHHATTRLCLAALQQIDLHGKSVLDIGTGSGVLAISASLLGAAPVLALDDDPDAIGSAHENLTLNPTAHVELRVSDLRRTPLTPAAVVLANLTGGLLVQAAAEIGALVAERGTLILSGFMQHEEADVLAAYRNLLLADRHQEDEWLCVALQRHGAYE
jgi:ribosomal protein L11 methyltransferase